MPLESGIIVPVPEAEPVVGDLRRLHDPQAHYGQWPECPPYGGVFSTVVPHLTVADRATTDVLDSVEVIVATKREAFHLNQA